MLGKWYENRSNNAKYKLCVCVYFESFFLFRLCVSHFLSSILFKASPSSLFFSPPTYSNVIREWWTTLQSTLLYFYILLECFPIFYQGLLYFVTQYGIRNRINFIYLSFFGVHTGKCYTSHNGSFGSLLDLIFRRGARAYSKRKLISRFLLFLHIFFNIVYRLLVGFLHSDREWLAATHCNRSNVS